MVFTAGGVYPSIQRVDLWDVQADPAHCPEGCGISPASDIKPTRSSRPPPPFLGGGPSSKLESSIPALASTAVDQTLPSQRVT
jgi:hypothetical protein